MELRALCCCRECDKAFPRRFVAYYGYAPDDKPKERRSHDEVVIAKRERAELMAKKREGRARYYAGRKAAI